MIKKNRNVGNSQSDNKNSNLNAIIALIVISIITKIIVFIATPNIFHAMIDTFDYNFYFDTIITPYVNNGQLPFINYNIDYPILAVIPIFIAGIPYILFTNKSLFFIIFPILMIICDIITTMCIYYTTLKIYNNTKKSFIAALLFTLSFSTAYFVITKYDAFPTCLMMMGIFFTISNYKSRGYVFNILGFLSKLYPVIILPIIVIFNAKSSTLKEEMISMLKASIPIVSIVSIPIIILNPFAITSYFSQTISRANGNVYVNSFSYTLYVWIHEIFGIGIQFDTISTIIYIIMVIIILSLFYIAYISKEMTPILLLELSLCVLFTMIIANRVHSPQYMMWITPLLCILVAGDFKKMGLFFISQVILFIEFPIAWGKLYVNDTYITSIHLSGGHVTLAFFTIEYIILFYLIFSTIDFKKYYQMVVKVK